MDSLGIEKPGLVPGNPILVLFEPGNVKLLEPEREPDNSISHGETLLCRLASISSHLTCKDELNKVKHHQNNKKDKGASHIQSTAMMRLPNWRSNMEDYQKNP